MKPRLPKTPLGENPLSKAKKQAKQAKRAKKYRGSYQNASNSNKNAIIMLFVIGAVALIMQVVWVGENKDKFVSPGMVKLFKTARKAEIINAQCYHCEGMGYILPGGASSPETEVSLQQITNAANQGNALLDEVTPTLKYDDICKICYGMGRSRIRTIYEDEMVCHNCHGMGRVFDPEGEPATCEVCSGRGMKAVPQILGINRNPVEYLIFECHTCNTDGFVQKKETRQKHPCPTCFGIGSKTVRKISENDSACSNCGGMGHIGNTASFETSTCGRCNGRGLTIRMTKTL